MEQYVVSRELAKKLKAAGYPQFTLRYWERYKDVEGVWKVHLATSRAWETSEYNAAPLSDELLEQLPTYIALDEEMHAHLEMTTAESKGLRCEYIDGHNVCYGAMYADKPADALASLWLWCKEHGYLEGGR